VVVALGGTARRWVHRHTTRPVPLPAPTGGEAGTTLTLTAPAPPAPPDAALVRTLRRGLLAELLVAAAVLAVTAALVTAVPPV
jgi:hypothetical protein